MSCNGRVSSNSLEAKANRLVLTTSYKLIKMPERNTYPFLEERRIKNDKQFM